MNCKWFSGSQEKKGLEESKVRKVNKKECVDQVNGKKQNT